MRRSVNPWSPRGPSYRRASDCPRSRALWLASNSSLAAAFCSLSRLPSEILVASISPLHPQVSWIGFLWFIVIAIGGFTAFGDLSQTVAPSIATTFSYVNPVIGIGLGWLLHSD